MQPGDSRNLILTGFMGTGKTSVGRLLAKRLDREFVDMDALIETREGASIPEIFRQHGEPHFRSLEAALCRELAAQAGPFLGRTAGATPDQPHGRVIATGGGALLDDANRDILSASGPLVCLTASPDEIVRRLEQCDDRPLLDDTDRQARVARLLGQRSDAYGQLPHQVDTSGLTVGQVTDQILALPLAPERREMAVRHPGGEYAIQLGRQLLAETGRLLQSLDPGQPLALVTNPVVGEIYGSAVLHGLKRAGYRTAVHTAPDGERYKTLDTVRDMYDFLVRAGLDRHGVVLALGGGVIGDMAGFAAATYLRGVPLVQLPTSLLAMVDSSVGGKVAVDLPQGKNLVGAFKQPVLVVADLDTLHTLPPSQVRSGLGEIVKTGLLGDPLLFEQLEEHGPAPISWIVERSLGVKSTYVEIDPYEQGQRALLNLGHTFAHALELLSHYTLSHGAAVSVGLVAATRLSARLGFCDLALSGRVEAILASVGLPIRIQGHSPENVWQAMATDKKRKGGKQRFILVRSPGDAFVTDAVPETEALAVLASLQDDSQPVPNSDYSASNP